MQIPPVQPDSPLQQILQRPTSERLREYKFRFAQTVVFGAPVIALGMIGSTLGPTDSQHWGGVISLLLSGWVVYVNLGMLIEGIIRHRVTGDLIVMIAALALFMWSAIGVGHVLATGTL